MNLPGARALPAHLLHAVMAVYAIVLGYYALSGPFDFTFLGARIYITDWVRPYQIFMAAAMARTIMFLTADLRILAGALGTARGIYDAALRNGSSALLGLIVAYSFGLRLWSLALGSQEEVFYDDALDFMMGVWHYLAWDYLFDTGYPDFSGHLTEWAVRLSSLVIGFLGYPPVEADRAFINLCAVSMNLVYFTGTIMMVYGLGKIIGRKDAGILAVFLVGVSITELQTAHYYINDVPMAFLAMLGVYSMALNLREEKPVHYILTGVFLALAFASKFNAALSFIYVGFIYLRLHPAPRDFVANLDKALKLALAFILVYILVNPLVLVDPGAKLDYTLKQAYYMTRPRGMGGFTEAGNTLARHLVLLFSQTGYHLWAIRGLFDPLPLIVGVFALGYAAWRGRFALMFLWASPILFVLIGRMTKPNSAPLHYLNLIPLLSLVVAVGLLDALKLIPYRWARGALLGVLGLWGAYQGLQDTSYWALPQSFRAQHNWLLENLDDHADIIGMKDLMILAKGDPRKIREVYTGPEKWCYALHRDARHYLLIKDGPPALFPKAHFPSQRIRSTIYPASADLAVTERMFATGIEPKLFGVERLVMADETDGSVAVFVKNASTKESRINLKIGRKSYKRNLKPAQAELFIVPVEGNRTFLYEGRYVEIRAESEEDTAWLVAARSGDIADLLMDTGDKAGALREYRRSDTAYARLRLMALADDPAERRKAGAELKKKFPSLVATMTGSTPDQWTFKSLAGWDDTVFRSKMTRSYGYDDFHKENIPPSGLTLGPRSAVWGPYQPIMKGEYRLDIRWLTAGAGEYSFLLDVATRRIPNNEIVRAISGQPARAGHLSLPVMEENPVDFPLEAFIGQAQGGSLGLEEVNLTIDYMGQLRKIAQAALEGVGLEELKGL